MRRRDRFCQPRADVQARRRIAAEVLRRLLARHRAGGRSRDDRVDGGPAGGRRAGRADGHGHRSGSAHGLTVVLAIATLAGAADLSLAARPAEAGRCTVPGGHALPDGGRTCAQADPRTWLLHPPRPPASLTATLQGAWAGRVSEDGLPVELRITLQPDGIYQREAVTGDGRKIQVIGTYTLSAATGTAGYMTFLPVSWKPAEHCTGTSCQPLDVLPSVTPYAMTDGNTLRFGEGVLYRAP